MENEKKSGGKKNLSASIRAKLLNRARETGEELQNLLTRFTGERLLYRLSVSRHRTDFLLKGAALFNLWFDQPHRPTKDLDLLGFGANDIPALEEKFLEICDIDGADGLTFLADSVKGSLIREEAVYGGVRLNLMALLEKARVPLQIDVGFGDAVTPAAREETMPTILDLPAPRLKVYPKETVVAEKLEAIVKLGLANSRMKDFWDINYLLREFDFDRETMRRALHATFANRRTDFLKDLPVALTDEFAANPQIAARWHAFIKRNRIATETDLGIIVDRLRAFYLSIN